MSIATAAHAVGTDPAYVPVIVGIGEILDRPEAISDALEPLVLMERAVLAAQTDSGGAVLPMLDALHLVGLVSWRYENPAASLCERLGIAPREQVNASMGGETPVRLIHEAAISIAKGEQGAVAIVGGEAVHSRRRAKRDGVDAGWSKQPPRERTVVFPSSRYPLHPLAKRLGIVDPVDIYPLYEMAIQHHWGETPAVAQRRSADLWAGLAQVAAGNPGAWIKTAPGPQQISEVTQDNRIISWPYTKLMVANPVVNQAAAILVTSLAIARELGVADNRIVHIWGGASAAEADDYLQRDGFHHSSAQEAVLGRAIEISGAANARFDRMELYSCFPVVPKMALRTLGLSDDTPISVAGGLTFFGGPLNNYMSHAACAMVREIRAAGGLGLLYGQGGYISKHHALVLSGDGPPVPLAQEHSVQDRAEALRGPVAEVVETYTGPATIETYSVRFGKDGAPLEGVVVLRTPRDQRTMARVPVEDPASLAALLDLETSAIGTEGRVRIDAFGKPAWTLGSQTAAGQSLRFCTVEREGHLTIITLDRPNSMNALEPAASAELAGVFDAFAADPEQWVAILTGNGPGFCSGNDLKWTAKALARGARLEIPTTGFGGLTARFDLDKPVIAAVNGPALGGGFEMALACDLIIASDRAIFGLPEPKVGLAAVAGGLLRLPGAIGPKRAMAMILTGKSVDAGEGVELGFVNEVVAHDELMTVARRWADRMLACSPMSIRASKAVVRQLGAMSFEDAYRLQNSLSATRALFHSADFLEGSKAFAEKRQPRWLGK